MVQQNGAQEDKQRSHEAAESEKKGKFEGQAIKAAEREEKQRLHEATDAEKRKTWSDEEQVIKSYEKEKKPNKVKTLE